MNFFLSGTTHQNRRGIYVIVSLRGDNACIRYQDGSMATADIATLRRIEESVLLDIEAKRIQFELDCEYLTRVGIPFNAEDKFDVRRAASEHKKKEVEAVLHIKAEIEFSPLIEIPGSWDKGFSVDLHTISSTPCGVNSSGYTIFDNKYTMLGELMNRCKYKNESSAVPLIANEVIARIKSISRFDIIIPVPPSNQFRPFQPVAEIAKAICLSTGVTLLEGAFDVKPHAQLKSITGQEERIKILKESITLSRTPQIEGKNVLIFDDLFRSGSTLTVICDLLRPFKPKRICVLTVTKTRSNK